MNLASSVGRISLVFRGVERMQMPCSVASACSPTYCNTLFVVAGDWALVLLLVSSKSSGVGVEGKSELKRKHIHHLSFTYPMDDLKQSLDGA